MDSPSRRKSLRIPFKVGLTIFRDTASPFLLKLFLILLQVLNESPFGIPSSSCTLLHLPPQVLLTILECDLLDAVDRCCFALCHKSICRVAASRPDLLAFKSPHAHRSGPSEERELLTRIASFRTFDETTLCFSCLRYRNTSKLFWTEWMNQRRIPQGIHSTNAIAGWINSVASGVGQVTIGKAICPECRISLPLSSYGLRANDLLKRQLE